MSRRRARTVEREDDGVLAETTNSSTFPLVAIERNIPRGRPSLSGASTSDRLFPSDVPDSLTVRVTLAFKGRPFAGPPW